jgi:formamidopyrimidine-DNA glycosylase
MPELPEVETMRRGVAAIVGCQVTALPAVRCRKRPILIWPSLPLMRRRLVGRTVLAVDRLGKRLVVRFDSGDSLVMEPRMTGLALLAEPPSREHLRFVLELGGGNAAELRFWDRRGLGSVRLFSEAELARTLGADKIGPDALAVSPTVLSARLGGGRRAIKVALLDQRAIAGVGNLYASEILHLAGIHPERSCQRLRPADWRRLHAALEEILHLAIRYEGSTLSDGTYRNALNESGDYQNHHRVYDREGDACRSCGRGRVARIVQAQRSTFFCARCQRPERSAASRSN